MYQNLGCGLPKEVETYDIKGSFNSRRYVKISEQRTKMDKNFLEDFKGMPLPISVETKKLIDLSIWNDSLFLCKQNIIDYSLLVIISLKHRVFTVGIIDYILRFNSKRWMESHMKELVGTEEPTIIKPDPYKVRFRENITTKIFLDLDE